MTIRNSVQISLALACATLSAGVAVASGAAHPVGGPDQFGGYASDHVLLRVTRAFSASHQSAPGQLIDGGAIDAVCAAWTCKEVQPAFFVPPRDTQTADALGLSRTFRLVVPTGSDTPAFVAALTGLPGVEFAELDGIGGIAAIPNDPLFDQQWGMNNTGQTGGFPDADINLPEAWDIVPGAGSVIVAMLDTGIRQNHPDLDAPGRWVAGWNTYDNNNLTDDVHGHGTHTAGIIGALANNGVGVVGVNPQVHLMPVRVVAPNGSGSEAQCAAGITWATDNGAQILSMSLQYYTGSQTLADAIAYANTHHKLCIAASGNRAGAIAFPAAFAGCMAIGASNYLDEIYTASNFGLELDIAAPGQSVISTWAPDLPIGNPFGPYATLSGTSMATPHVSGAASLIWAHNPSLSADDIVSILRNTAHDLGAPGFDPYFGYGRLDVRAALLAATLRADMNCDGFVNNFDIDPFVLALTNPLAYQTSYPSCPTIAGDVNHDGVFNNFDIDPFVTCLVVGCH